MEFQSALLFFAVFQEFAGILDIDADYHPRQLPDIAQKLRLGDGRFYYYRSAVVIIVITLFMCWRNMSSFISSLQALVGA